DPLTAPMKIAGEPIANLVASTSGADSDWVVKLIDVYPDEVGGDAVMGGYQLMIAADIFRGRYREDFATARRIARDTPLLYRFALPTANHVSRPGHRIMVQIQSSWFPLYDRNPQTFVPNIFWAKSGDYRKATQRIYHPPKHSSFVELPVAAPLTSAHAPAGRARPGDTNATSLSTTHDIQSGKGECGLDEQETRGWVGWHHPTALSLLALAFLVLQKRRLGKKRGR